MNKNIVKKTENQNEDIIVKQKRQLKQQARDTQRMLYFVVSALVLLALCVLVIGILNILKNSPSHAMVVFRDRRPPVASVHNAVALNGQTYDIQDYVDSIDDISFVSMSYVSAPDYESDGNQQIVIRFTDEAGNYTDKSLMLQVIHDKTAPTIYVDDEIYSFWNEPVSYKSFITVEDDIDNADDLDIEIDNSQVDIATIGEYPLTYTVTDSAGNVATKTVIMHILEPDTDEYYLMKANEICDMIIQQIITPGMDDLHKVWEVYEYVRNIDYQLTDYTRNYIREGYKLLNNMRGDCYGSYAATRLLLDRLGIMNIPIQADESWGNRHFWNMVSIDGGATWYHVDATNWTEWSYKPNMCMISDTRLYEISRQHGGTHIYDQSEYPETPYYSMDVPDDIYAKYEVYNF